MFILGSVVTNLILAVSLILAASVAGLMAYHYAKARLRERQGYIYDPDTETVEPDRAGMEQRAKSAEEIAQIRTRIETLMEQQQMAAETQGQHLGQKLDEIRTHMGQQDMKMDGLKSELRHEIRSRDSELGELRGQLAAALDAFWKSMPALSEGDRPSDTRALPPAMPNADETDHLAQEPGAAPEETASYEYADKDLAEFTSTSVDDVSAEATFASDGTEPASFSPIEPEAGDFNPEMGEATFAPLDPETASFEPIGPMSEAPDFQSELTEATFAPIEPEANDFTREMDEATFAPLDPETASIEPIEPAEEAPDFEFELDDATFAPIQPETISFEAMNPVADAPDFESEPAEATFTPTEPETASFESIEPAPEVNDVESELAEATFSPIEPETASFETIEPTAETPDFESEPAETTVAPIEPEAATFAPIELEPEAPMFASIERTSELDLSVTELDEAEDAVITPINQEPAPEPMAATFEAGPAETTSEPFELELTEIEPDQKTGNATPESFEVTFEAIEPDADEAVEFMLESPTVPADIAAPDAPTFEPIEFAPMGVASEAAEVEDTATESAEHEVPVFDPIEPPEALFTTAEEIETTETAHEPEPVADTLASEPADDTAQDTTSIQPVAPLTGIEPEIMDAEPEAEEAAIWTSAAAWTEPSLMAVTPEPTAAEVDEEPTLEAPSAEEPSDEEQAASVVEQVVVSPTGDSISVQPEDDVKTAQKAPAEASPSVLDASLLFTGNPELDAPQEAEEVEPSAGQEFEQAQIAEAAVETKSEPAREDRPPAPSENSVSAIGEDRDDLTVISSITPETQQLLYDIGITKLDEMARWSRADARRVGSQVDISEETIMHQWIFEAQSVLFDSFQDKMARHQASRQAS